MCVVYCMVHIIYIYINIYVYAYIRHVVCVYVCLLNQAPFQNKSNMWEERFQKEDL